MIFGNVNIFGRVGSIDELVSTNNGKKVLNISVAEDLFSPSDLGEPDKSTQWHKVAIWGDMADKIKKECKVGDEVFVTGNLKYRTYERDGLTVKNAHIDAVKIKQMRKVELKIQWDSKTNLPQISEETIK